MTDRNCKRRAMLIMVVTACLWSIGGIFIGEVPGKCALIGACIIITMVSWWCVAENRE